MEHYQQFIWRKGADSSPDISSEISRSFPYIYFEIKNSASPINPLNTAHNIIKFVEGCANHAEEPNAVWPGKNTASNLDIGKKDTPDTIQLNAQPPQKNHFLFPHSSLTSVFGAFPRSPAKTGTCKSKTAIGILPKSQHISANYFFFVTALKR